jgi:hypothetical protein
LDEIGPGKHDHVGPTKFLERLAESPPGKYMPVAKRLQRIKQDDIQVSVKPSVLEAVV